jgi:peptidoglycan/xylan/chitin deacetylase (PgdA/CDA1 family)
LSTPGTTPKHPGLPADIIDLPEPRSFGIGFDDGPNCSHNAFYEFLRENNQRATMFYIGSNVMDWPLQAQDAITDGHEICVHTWSHNYMTALTTEQAFAELWYTRKAVQLVTGVTPMCWYVVSLPTHAAKILILYASWTGDHHSETSMTGSALSPKR